MRSLLFFALILLSLPVSATISQVQSNATWNTIGATTCAVRFNNSTSNGDLIAVWTSWSVAGGPNNITITSVKDTFNNPFLNAVGPTLQPTSYTAAQILYARDISPGSNDSVTVTFSGTPTWSNCVIVEYSGADATNPLDSAIGSYSSSSTAFLESGNLIPASSNLLIFAGGIADNTGLIAMTAGSGFAGIQASDGSWGTAIVENATATLSGNSTLPRATACVGINSGSTSLPCPPGGTSANWLMEAAVFRESPSTVAGGWNPVRPYQVADATQFPGTDPCAQTKTAIEIPINNNQAPVVDSRGFISTSIPCANPPFAPQDMFEWFAPSGPLQMSSTMILGGQSDIYGTTVGYSALNGTTFEAQNSAWCPGVTCTGGLGGVSQGTYSSSQYYWRGSTAICQSPNCVVTNTYYALQNGFSGQTPGTSAGAPYWSLAAGFPSPVVEENMTTQNKDVEANSLHNLSLDCQYANGTTQTWTDGCVGYLSSWGQENTVLDRVKVRNATVAGIYLDNPGAANSGPFGPGVIGYDSPGTNSNQAACKTAGSDQSTQQALINTITVISNNAAVVTLNSNIPLWVGEVVDIVNTAVTTPYSNIPVGYTEEGTTNKTHGFWSVYSVIASNEFLIYVPYASGTNPCTSSCGTANFYPIGLEVNMPTSGSTSPPNTKTRGFNGWTINGSSCVNGGSNYSDFPPIGAEFSAGDSPMRNYHTEGFRIATAIGSFGPSQGQHIENAWLEVNTYVGVLLDNKFGPPTADIRDLQCSIPSGGATGPVVNCIVDLQNNNKITEANNPYVAHYWVDANGTAYFDGGDCADMTKGWCRGNTSGSTDAVWTYYSNNLPVFSVDGTAGALTAQNVVTTQNLVASGSAGAGTTQWVNGSTPLPLCGTGNQPQPCIESNSFFIQANSSICQFFRMDIASGSKYRPRQQWPAYY